MAFTFTRLVMAFAKLEWHSVARLAMAFSKLVLTI